MAYNDVKDKILQIVREVKEDLDVEQLYARTYELIEYLDNSNLDIDYACKTLNACAESIENIRIKAYFYSIMLQMPLCLSKENDSFSKIIDTIYDSTQFSVREKQVYFLMISYRMFVTPFLQTDQNKVLLWKSFNNIVREYHDVIWKESHFPYITKEKRNENFYVVIADQILAEEHGPTKSAFDRCRALMSLGNNVLLINTGENCFEREPVLFYGSVYANHADEFDELESIHYQGYDIPFCQIGKGIMDVDKLTEYLRIIYEYKPNMVIDIGGSTLLGNLCNYFIPVLAVTLGPDNLIRTTEKFQTLGRKLNDNDRQILQQIGYPEDKVIEMMMTFEVKEQKTTLSKSDLGMREDDFEVIVVGGRLDEEVSPEFLELIRSIADSKDNIHFNFCGRFTKYDEIIGADRKLSNVCSFLGMQSDIMAVLDNIDLYVNPIRLGGGTSAQEAMLKGIPVVTCKVGDVYANCHDEFAVNNYDEMAIVIKKYMEDTAYYKTQSDIARRLADMEHDTIGEFNRIIEECRKRDDDNFFHNDNV